MSYFFDVRIDFASSLLNSSLYLVLSKGRYQLGTENAIYSFEDLYTNFVRAFKLVNWKKLVGNEVLLLGFGLGSVVNILEKLKLRDFSFTGVELDEVIVKLAEKYCLPSMDSAVELVCANALDYVRNCSRQFDLIVVDIFVDDVIPLDFRSVEFLTEVDKLLSVDGLLFFNCLSRTAEDIELTNSFYENVFKSIFPNAVLLDVDGNYILLNKGDFMLRA